MAIAGAQSAHCSRRCWSIVIVSSILTAIGIALLAGPMAPMQPGTSAKFWQCACGVTFGDASAEFGGGHAYFVDDQWAAYEVFHLHGSDVYFVPRAEVLADFEIVLAALQDAVEAGRDSAFVTGYSMWRSDTKQPQDEPALLKSIRQARFAKLAANSPEALAYVGVDEQLFWRRWQRANWYWANIVFEWAFLNGLVVFALWPGIRQRSIWHWSVHFGLTPLLFLFPVYLGYASFSFTSAGPVGGILYPFLLSFCRGGTLNAFDTWLLARVPQVLEPLSTPIGSPMALTGMGMPGPTTMLLTGTYLGALTLATYFGVRKWRNSRFERAKQYEEDIVK